MEVLSRFENWLRARGLRERSVRRYIKAARRLLQLYRLEELDMERVEEFLAPRPSHAPAVKVFLKFLGRYDERFKHMYEELKLPRRDCKLPEVLTEEEVDRLISAGRTLEERAFMAVLYETGARLFEVLNLRRQDVVESDYGFEVVIRDSKSLPRNVLVIKYAWLLKLWLRHCQGERLFSFSERKAENIVRAAAERAGIGKRVTPHILRHSRATHMIGKRILSESEAMLWFGWRTRSMLDRYVHLTMRSVHEKVLSYYGREAERPQPIVCKTCFQVNEPGASYCVRCGAPLGEEAEERAREAVSLQAQLLELRSVVQQLAREVARLKRMK